MSFFSILCRPVSSTLAEIGLHSFWHASCSSLATRDSKALIFSDASCDVHDSAFKRSLTLVRRSCIAFIPLSSSGRGDASNRAMSRSTSAMASRISRNVRCALSMNVSRSQRSLV